jgi:error-prone DNA polymerase
MSGYVELQCASHFSFLRGVSSADELFATAAMLGMESLAVTDLNSLSGIVRAHEAARATGVRLIVGCRLRLRDGSDLLVYPKDRPAYARLCRLLSVGKGRAGKAKCDLTWEDVGDWAEGLIGILVPDRPNAALRTRLKRLKTIWPVDGYCALTLRRRPGDALHLHQVAQMAAEFGVFPVVTNDVLFHEPSRRVLQNVVTCIRERCTIDTAGFKLERHADRYLKAPPEISRLFRLWPDAVARSAAIAEQLRFR